MESPPTVVLQANTIVIQFETPRISIPQLVRYMWLLNNTGFDDSRFQWVELCQRDALQASFKRICEVFWKQLVDAERTLWVQELEVERPRLRHVAGAYQVEQHIAGDIFKLAQVAMLR